jgi:sec-independent protein translocase protein TatA
VLYAGAEKSRRGLVGACGVIRLYWGDKGILGGAPPIRSETMGSLSPWHLIILALLLLLVFGGRGKLSGIMGDAAKGIKAFKDGLKDEDKAEDKPAAAPAQPLPPASASAEVRKEDKHTAA